MSVLVHLSDTHVSTFGDSFHFPRQRVVRSRSQYVPPPSMQERWSEFGWHLFADARDRKLVLVDSDGYVHKGWAKRGAGASEAAAYAERMSRRHARALAARLPDADELLQLYAATPDNTNLRLLAAVRALPEDAKFVFVTGDLTDDGDGYELLEAAFAPWIERGRFFAVPGNHDLFTVLMPSSVRPKPTRQSKREAWLRFAARIGLDVDASGAWAHCIEQEQVMLVGLDSCNTPQRRFFLHNGAIEGPQLRFLRELSKSERWKNAKLRVVGLHHHVVPVATGVGRRAPPEIGMRLDNARQVAEVFNELGVDLVLHGHRHISEERRPAGSRFRLLAAPSATLGCRSGEGPSWWSVDLAARGHAERVVFPWPSVEHTGPL